VSFDVVDAKRISDAVFPKIVANVLRGLRKPVPRSATFLPACVLDSTVGLEDGPGDWNVHQMHVVLPARPGRCRLLFRLSVDFVAVPEIARAIGGEVWANLAQMVLKEQLEGVRASGVDDEKSYQEWKVSVSGDFD
jgi:chlorophyllide a oxygenase